MYKYKAKTSLTFKETKPNTDDFYMLTVWNESQHHSRKTAMNIKHRINDLIKISNGDYVSVLKDILTEIDLEIQ